MSSSQTNSYKCLHCCREYTKFSSLSSHIGRVHCQTYTAYKQHFGLDVIEAEECRLQTLEKQNVNLERRKKKLDDARKRCQLLSCQVCGFESEFSLISHIIRVHSITMNEYRLMYPNNIVQRMPQKQRENCAKLVKLWFDNEKNKEAFLKKRSFPSEVKHWLRKGFSEEQAKQKVIEFQRCQSLKGNNEKTRKLRSEKSSGERNPMSMASIAKRFGVSLEEAKKFTPCYGRTGDKHPMFSKHHTDEARMKIASSPHLISPDYRSEPERELEIRCREVGEIDTNVQVSTWNVDVVFRAKKLIVEMFGDFWHMNPSKFSSDCVNCVLKKSAFQIWERDSRRLSELKNLGYDVLIVWEQDWHCDKEGCVKRIKDAYDRTL